MGSPDEDASDTPEPSACEPGLAQAQAELSQARARLRASDHLAKLGELSAGVAHELRNPLHFVSNFSASALELLAELRETLTGGAPAPQVLEQLTELESVITSIHEHSARANHVVVTVLAHSKQASGVRVDADFNQILRSAQRLAHHGHRAKHPEVEVRLLEHYDDSIGSFEVARDDLSRAFLNLLDNAYQAMGQHSAADGSPCDPELTITTRDLGDHVEARICDNGPGISPELAKRVFEPFFTTKPADRGTGLGLSISRELVTGGAQGTLVLELGQDHGCAFVVTVPKRPALSEG